MSLNSCQFCLDKLDHFFIDENKTSIYLSDDHPNSIELKRNNIIFSEGKYPKGIYYIHKGLVKIFKHGTDGKEQIIQICQAGDVIGFRAIFSENRYNVNAAALEDFTEICFISQADFSNYKNSNVLLQKKLIQELSAELQEWADFVTNMTQKSVKQRTALALLFLHDIYQDRDINISREDLANMVGTATETLIRLIKQFKMESLIAVNGRKIKVLDFKALKKLSSS